jgi:putative acetyltransferase
MPILSFRLKMAMQPEIRRIREEDNAAICAVIKSVFEEHGINRPGTAYYDKTLDTLSEVFTLPNSAYFVAIWEDKVVGGAGIYPTEGLPAGTCELVKMYLLPHTRGKGLGKLLIENCMNFARKEGYKQVYLETMPELEKAVAIYRQLGFVLLPGPLGNSGHYSCPIHMLKAL